MKPLTILLLLAATAAAVASLVTGASYLGFVVSGGLPVGNVIAAIALIAPAVLAVVVSAPGSALKTAALVMLCAALAWLPVSILLAGNLALNFSGWRGSAWMGFSLVTGLGVLCVLAWATVHRLAATRPRI